MQRFRQVATDLDQACGRHLQRNRTSGYDVPSSPTLIVYIGNCQWGLANCLEFEPYMFEQVCQSGESESNDSHADTDSDSDSDTDGDMYRGLCNSGASVRSRLGIPAWALAHQPVQLWCKCTK